MKILMLSWRDLRHARAGGSEVYTQRLAKEWADRGHEVTYFCAAVPDSPTEERVDGYTVVRRGSRFSVYRCARSYFSDLPTRPDVVLDIVNTRPFLTPRWVGDTPVVAFVHQLAADVWRHEVPLPAALLGRYYLEPRWLTAYRDTPTLALSRSTYDDLTSLGLRRVKVAPVGLERPLQRPVAKAVVPTIAFVGRLAENKRPDHAVQAFRSVRRLLPTAEMHVVGEGPLRRDLERSAPEGVIFHGRTSNEERDRILASAHALVATSVREGWGLTVSEAALLGTRTVGYRVPGLVDSVGAAGGVLVDPRPHALASALCDVLPRWQGEGPVDVGSAGVVPWRETAREVLCHLESATSARLARRR